MKLTTMPEYVASYRMPNPLRNEDDFYRLRCEDIDYMTVRECAAEELRVKRVYSFAQGRQIYMHGLSPSLWWRVDEWCEYRLGKIAERRTALRRRAS